MQIITTSAMMQQKAAELKRQGKTIGYVPTMGYLHEGHLKLVKNSVGENDITVISIFVNPLQFGPNEDLEAYPRDPKRDTELAREAGVDVIFMPDAADMYPNELSMNIEVTKRADVLCGRSRPGHFNGVATVLIKLFNIILPDRVYFGSKDAQQTAIVEGLIADFNFPIKLIAVETAREADGLAKSSRNVYLLNNERQQAPAIYRSLLKAEKIIKDGESDPAVITQLVKEYIEKNTDGVIDYVEVLSYPQLSYQIRLEGKVIIAIAVKFSKARLIDNLIITVNKEVTKCSVQ
ncbi:pantoate--beta-alanine ligase [Lederbergia lenta]|uniref:Pantothenate synthetase n=1 Tax=Lederbergia lenta TaxID=1467 RepID=A0A2X4WG67_LEDLE|nr:pantoate--beta-alanine ligase [Lederbergia lenta]MEC2324940.1 pantoate--beta-alanine ligase [Lederbergia lenta]SQI56600.1 pantoate--beta-alanine ligase [Lederbergia lenta]